MLRAACRSMARSILRGLWRPCVWRCSRAAWPWRSRSGWRGKRSIGRGPRGSPLSSRSRSTWVSPAPGSSGRSLRPSSTVRRAPWKSSSPTEAQDPADGPFRIHCMPAWHPHAFFRSGSKRRLNEQVAWERDTLFPSYASAYDLQYTMTIGVLELYDYLQLFRPRPAPASRRDAEFLGVAPGQRVTAFPRRSFDLWNTRYFILPVRPDDWTGDSRGYASFLRQAELVHPRVDQFSGPAGKPQGARWRDEEDWQIFRNKAAYPRAWIVHDARWFKPLGEGPSSDRDLLMGGLLFQNDAFWSDPGRPVARCAQDRLGRDRRSNDPQGLLSRRPARSHGEGGGKPFPAKSRADGDAPSSGPGDSRRCVLPRLAVANRRQGCAHFAGEPNDARRGRRRGHSPPGLLV